MWNIHYTDMFTVHVVYIVLNLRKMEVIELEQLSVIQLNISFKPFGGVLTSTHLNRELLNYSNKE